MSGLGGLGCAVPAPEGTTSKCRNRRRHPLEGWRPHGLGLAALGDVVACGAQDRADADALASIAATSDVVPAAGKISR